MKGSRIYMIFLGVFLLLVFLFEYMSPHKFSWKQTFDRNDREPFGCYVFDDVVSSSVGNYTVTDKSFFQIVQDDSVTSPRAFLVVENYVMFGRTDIESLYKLLHAGNRVMICAENFPYTLKDTLRFETEYGRYLPDIRQYIYDDSKQRDSIFSGTDTLRPAHVYEVYPQMHLMYFVEGNHRTYSDTADVSNDTVPVAIEAAVGRPVETQHHPMNCDSAEVLAWNSDNRPLAIRLFIGEGELFIVTTPLMFTNYGLLDGKNASYAFGLLSRMGGNALIRTEAYGRHSGSSGTPLRYVLSEPPLRWAVYSTLTLLVLFMGFAARRRQRVIPAVKTPPNRTLGFMQLISNLYYQKHENGEILKMKNTYFCAEVKRLTGVDLQERVPDEAACVRLSEKTGMDKDTLRTLINNINRKIYLSDLYDMELKQCIDDMNNILHSLKS
jgi:hypothetical protein